MTVKQTRGDGTTTTTTTTHRNNIDNKIEERDSFEYRI